MLETHLHPGSRQTPAMMKKMKAPTGIELVVSATIPTIINTNPHKTSREAAKTVLQCWRSLGLCHKLWMISLKKKKKL